MQESVPRIAITPGEPAGIGPELVARLVAETDASCERVIVADPDLIRARAGAHALRLREFDASATPQGQRAGEASILPVPLVQPSTAGKPDPANAASVLRALEHAVSGCRDGTFDALVTGPVHKGVINDAGVPFTGHTEFIAGTDEPVMMLVADTLRVALLTTHVPLSSVPGQVCRDRVERIGMILHRDLQRHFGIERPRILVLGLNPHAGEDGHIGHEDRDEIAPAIASLHARGLAVTGPVPADTAFTPTMLRTADAVLAMYHDQGLPVLKHVGFGHAVNVTLGLPFIRTSVDHGTALDLAGTGRADGGSLQAAMDLAVTMIRRRRDSNGA